jgi:hypothetical protein
MKKIIYSLFIACLAFGFASCDESTHDTSKITYYIEVELDGATTLLWPKGTSYVEPGYTAILDGEDVTSQVVVNGSVNTDLAGIYTLTYSAVNVDGFSNAKTRTIFVYDSTDSPLDTGFYTVSKDSYRDYNGQTAYGKEFTITIYQTEPGMFYVSDFIGGWYDQRAGYGSAYAMTGHFKLNADNSIEAIDSYVSGWGDSMNSMTGSYDPATQTITWDINYTDYPFIFHVVITKS